MKVLAAEVDPIGTIFACHKHRALPESERGMCAGWLLDQRARNVPSIALRLALSKDLATATALERVTAASVELFRTVKAMCRANGVRPSKDQIAIERDRNAWKRRRRT